MALSDLLQGCSKKSDTVMISKNVTRLMTQGCNNIAVYIYNDCIGLVVTTLQQVWQYQQGC
jgi:hypothetical protein